MRATAREVLAARRARWLIALSLAFGVLLAATSLTAAAGLTTEASGTFTQVSFETSNTRTVGEVTLFDFTESDVLSGTFSGTSIIEGSCVVQPSGEAVCHALETFNGTVNGRSGTATFFDVIFPNLATGAVHGNFTIISGTGELENLRGHGTFQGEEGTGTYTGTLIWVP